MSIRRILVPTDFSHPATRATHCATELANAIGASVELLHVVNRECMQYHLSWASTGLQVDEISEEENARDRLHRMASVLTAHGIPTRGTVIGPIETIPGILKAAAHADLIVLASGPWADRQLEANSISMRVAHQAPCPVLLVTAEACELTPDALVLVPTDLSEASATALRLARELAAALGGTVEVVHALSPSTEAASWGGEPVEAEDELPESRRQRYVKRFVNAVGGPAVPLELRLVEGPPVEALAQVAAEDHPNLIVVGQPADRPDAPDQLLDAMTTAAPCPALRAPSP